MRVIETSLDHDLSVFSKYLWQRRIRHRVFEERGRQVMVLADPADADDVRAAFAAWSAGRLVLERQPAARAAPGALQRIGRFPAVTALIAAALVAFPFTAPLSHGRVTWLASVLMLVDPGRYSGAAPSILDVLAEGELWRWLSPAFIHFSVIHLVFNCAVVIELGRRVERGLGSVSLLLFVALLGVVSNLGQYGVENNPFFGGLSGVAYGLLGFVLVMNRLLPERLEWQLPAGFSGGLLFFLVVFSTGVTEHFGLVVANAAHWFGLIAGAATAVIVAQTSHARR